MTEQSPETDFKSIVAQAIARGWARLQEPQPESRSGYDHRRYLLKRDSRYSSGLTSKGNRWQRVKRPELKGFIGAEYHREYMRMIRAERKQRSL